MWTIDQQKAIDLEGTNIIVSAGAGSGKTAVLSERVLRKVKSGIHINELLILTFTKAAAFEMKERIRKKLKEANLKEEANLIDSAFITTFDAFSLALVKKYHTKLNVTHNISITDEVLINFEKKRILAEIMEENYLTCSKNFTNLINDFCLKDDEKLQEYLLNIYKKLELKYDKEAFLDTYIEKYYSTENIDSLLNEYNTMLLEKITEMKNILGDRKICLARELTKIHEEFLIDTISNLLEKTQDPKGEYVIVVEGSSLSKKEKETNKLNEMSIEQHYKYYEKLGYDKKEIIKKIAKDRNVSKNEIYKLFV